MIQKQFYKIHNSPFFFIIYFLIVAIVNGKPFDPITPDIPDTMIFLYKGNEKYYHKLPEDILDSLTYSQIIKRKNIDNNVGQEKKVRIKIRARANKIISSSKWINFGIKITNYMSGNPKEIDLKFRKRIDKKFSYEQIKKNEGISQAGRWFFDIDLPTSARAEDDTIDFVIKHHNGSKLGDYENIYIRFNVEEIQHQKEKRKKGEKVFIQTIDHPILHFVDSENTGDPFEYYGLNIGDVNRTEHQFKITGPLKVRVYTRPEEDKKDIEYSIKLSENGLLLGEYIINKYIDQESGFIETDYFHFTVPKSEHFYTLSSDEKVFIRLTKYREAQSNK